MTNDYVPFIQEIERSKNILQLIRSIFHELAAAFVYYGARNRKTLELIDLDSTNQITGDDEGNKKIHFTRTCVMYNLTHLKCFGHKTTLIQEESSKLKMAKKKMKFIFLNMSRLFTSLNELT